MKVKLLKDLIKKHLDLDLYAYKESQLNRRLTYFIEKNNIVDIENYCISLKNNSIEREKFISYVTINVTKFYRDISFFEKLEEEIKKNPKTKHLKIWSAACSYGCEPYTLALMLENMGYTNYKIIATDIDSQILNQAEKGIFSEPDIKDVPPHLLKKYFKIENDKYIINESLKKNIVFKKHNLLQNNYESGYDLIVCRNVVIYFTMEAKNEIYRRFVKSLNSDGILFVGPTEHLSSHKELGLTQLQPCIYQK